MDAREDREKHCGLPAAPEGRLDGQRFFRVAGRDFHYLFDTGEGATRDVVWAKALAYAVKNRVSIIEERTNQRLNDYVGPGVFGLCRLNGEISNRLLSGDHEYGASKLVATYMPDLNLPPEGRIA